MFPSLLSPLGALIIRLEARDGNWRLEAGKLEAGNWKAAKLEAGAGGWT